MVAIRTSRYNKSDDKANSELEYRNYVYDSLANITGWVSVELGSLLYVYVYQYRQYLWINYL